MRAHLRRCWALCVRCELDADWNEAACPVHHVGLTVERGTWTVWVRGADNEITRGGAGTTPEAAFVALDS